MIFIVCAEFESWLVNGAVGRCKVSWLSIWAKCGLRAYVRFAKAEEGKVCSFILKYFIISSCSLLKNIFLFLLEIFNLKETIKRTNFGPSVLVCLAGSKILSRYRRIFVISKSTPH